MLLNYHMVVKVVGLVVIVDSCLLIIHSGEAKGDELDGPLIF